MSLSGICTIQVYLLILSQGNNLNYTECITETCLIQFIDFSDDEEERRFKAKKRNKSKEGSADGDQEGKRKPQTKRKQDDHQR